MQTLTREDVVNMRKAGKVASRFLKILSKFIRPGISTKDIEIFFENYLKKYKDMESAFKGFCGYPASLCVSVNEEIIHGIPRSDKIIQDKDIVSVDIGIKYKGLFVDTAYTYIVGRASKMAYKLVNATKKALYLAIKKVRAGIEVKEIGSVIQNFVEKNGFSVIRKFVGHSIGRDLHLPPEIPNFRIENLDARLLEGMAIAIEPMVTGGDFEVEVLDDGWTAVTKDRSLSAHFEHTVLVTKNGALILTK